MEKINRKSAKHYKWKEMCDGWHFLERDDLSVIAEKMPPKSAENMHYHNISRQFFYILSGEATMCFKDRSIVLNEGEGIEIEPREAHQMINNSNFDVEFIVVSMPKSHGDKVVVE